MANTHKLPLWPISRGKNFGYGGAAPRLKGSVVLDLSRMKKIEFDAENGTALLEPGVGFYDLYDYIQKNKLPYWTVHAGQQLGLGGRQCAGSRRGLHHLWRAHGARSAAWKWCCPPAS